MPSFYGIGQYGQGQYSRRPLVDISGDLTPSIVFAGNLGVIANLAGDMSPLVTFGPSPLTTPQNIDGDLAIEVVFAAEMSLIYAVYGDIAPQTALGASLAADFVLTGDMAVEVDFAATAFLGPLWQVSGTCPPPAWEESTLCPPPLWTPTVPPNWVPSGVKDPFGYGMQAYGKGNYNDFSTPWLPVAPLPPVTWAPSAPPDDAVWDETELCDG
jgi:hypothetical protein